MKKLLHNVLFKFTSMKPKMQGLTSLLLLLCVLCFTVADIYDINIPESPDVIVEFYIFLS